MRHMTYINSEEQQFLNLIQEILDFGIEEKNDRTGVGTKFLVGRQLKFSLENNTIPILQTREIRWKNIFWEMIWIIRGETNVNFLKDKGVNIWNSWANKETGELGPVYGKQLRKWTNMVEKSCQGQFTQSQTYYDNEPVDQLHKLIEGLKTNPASRRHVFTLWNPTEINQMALPPCHANLFQFVVDAAKKELYTTVTCRSTDVILGAPVNIAEWSLFTHFVASLTGFKAKEITMTFNNPHVYLNHLEGSLEWIKRAPSKAFPTIQFNKSLKSIKDLENLTMEDVFLIGYEPQKPNIKFPVAV